MNDDKHKELLRTPCSERDRVVGKQVGASMVMLGFWALSHWVGSGQQFCIIIFFFNLLHLSIDNCNKQ